MLFQLFSQSYKITHAQNKNFTLCSITIFCYKLTQLISTMLLQLSLVFLVFHFCSSSFYHEFFKELEEADTNENAQRFGLLQATEYDILVMPNSMQVNALKANAMNDEMEKIDANYVNIKTVLKTDDVIKPFVKEATQLDGDYRAPDGFSYDGEGFVTFITISYDGI